MIKKPVNRTENVSSHPVVHGIWQILDADGTLVAEAMFDEAVADQIVSALNAQQPKQTDDDKCEYCGACRFPRPAGEWQFGCKCYDPAKRPQPKCGTCGGSKQLLGTVDAPGKSCDGLPMPYPCPDCRPSGDSTAEAINALCELFDGAVVNISEPYATYLTSLIAKAKQAAARISALEKALGEHRWISVSERLPEKTGVYLVLPHHEHNPTLWYQDGWYWYDQQDDAICETIGHNSDEPIFEVTHWKLIILPKAALKEQE